MEVTETKDYDQFKYLPENRPIIKSHVVLLKDSICRKNFLHVNPIIVDENFFVLDGQHRLQAAKELEIPIHYTMQEGEKCTESLFLLQKSRGWSLNDYINYYIKTDPEKGYDQFEKHKEKYKIPNDILACLYSFYSFSEHSYGQFTTKKMIKAGLFRFNSIDLESMERDVEQYLIFREFCTERRIKPTSIYGCGSSVIAFCCFAGFYTPNWKVFFRRLEERWFTLKPEYSYRSFVRSLVKMYNYKKGAKILCLETFEQESNLPGFTLAREPIVRSNYARDFMLRTN
jgi:hypothetical protein